MMALAGRRDIPGVALLRATGIAAALLLAGCAASLPPVEATRFHLGQPIQPGTVAVVALPDPKSIEMQGFVAAVEGELSRLGFTSAPIGSARYTAGLEVTRSIRPTVTGSDSPVSVGVGGSTGSFGSGVGVGIGINLGGGRNSRETVVTELAVQLKNRSDESVIWEGRAQLAARGNSPAAEPGLAAGKLAAALFKDFPGESGRTISVP